MRKTDAIFALNPSVVTVREGVAYDADENVVDYDVDAVNAWVDPNAYKAERKKEYPSIGDQLDALWKGGDDAAAMLEQVMAVKSKYPKPE